MTISQSTGNYLKGNKMKFFDELRTVLWDQSEAGVNSRGKMMEAWSFQRNIRDRLGPLFIRLAGCVDHGCDRDPFCH